MSENYSVTLKVKNHSLRTRTTELGLLCFYLHLPLIVLHKAFYMKKDFQTLNFDLIVKDKIRLKTTLKKCNFRSLLICSVGIC